VGLLINDHSGANWRLRQISQNHNPSLVKTHFLVLYGRNGEFGINI
jgi:hypothetical protein